MSSTAVPRPPAPSVTDALAIADWRRRVAALYGAVRAEPDPQTAWAGWVAAREDLLATHPQSPRRDRPAHTGQGAVARRYHPYDAALRFVVPLAPLPEATPIALELGEDGPATLLPFARTDGLAAHLAAELPLYWIGGYGGGVFLPFSDATSGRATFAGGRYLLDTIKGADLGRQGERIVLDFNFAYNPSCAYDARWTCPLAPAGNRLPAAIAAGELAPAA